MCVCVCVWITTHWNISIQIRSYCYQISNTYIHTAIPAFKYLLTVISSIHILCQIFIYGPVLSVEIFAKVGALKLLDMTYNFQNSIDINIWISLINSPHLIPKIPFFYSIHSHEFIRYTQYICFSQTQQLITQNYVHRNMFRLNESSSGHPNNSIQDISYIGLHFESKLLQWVVKLMAILL